MPEKSKPATTGASGGLREIDRLASVIELEDSAPHDHLQIQGAQMRGRWSS